MDGWYVIRIISCADGEKFLIYRPSDERGKPATMLRRIMDQFDTEPCTAGEMAAWLDQQPQATKQHHNCYLVDIATCALFRLWFDVRS